MITLEKQNIRNQIIDFFHQTATGENAKNKQLTFDDILDKSDNKRLLVVLPNSLGDVFISTSLFKSLREQFPRPEWRFYFATEPSNFELLDGNPYIDKVIPYMAMMDNTLFLEGTGENKGWFNVVRQLHFHTQRLINYVSNGDLTLGLELNYE